MSHSLRVVVVILILLGNYGNCLAKVMLKKQALEGKNVYVLENKFLRLIINPFSGGRGESLIYKKTGNGLTRVASRAQAAGGSGLFIDRFWGESQIKNFEVLPYKIEFEDKSPYSVSVKLSNTYHNLQVAKTITLQEGCSSLQIDYRITNEGNKNYTGRFWVTNNIFPGGSPKKLNFFYPYGKFSSNYSSSLTGRQQVTQINYIPGEEPSNNNNWINDPTRAWGAVSSGDKIGAAFEVEYPYLERFYSYQPSPGKSEPIPTFEWLYAPMKLLPFAKGKAEAILHPELADPLKGYIFRTGWRLIPFSGLPTVDGVADGIVGSIVIDKEQVRVGLASDRNRDLEVVLSRYRLPLEKQKEEELDKRKIDLSADKTVTFSLAATHKDKGTYVYKVTLRARKDNHQVATFEASYIYKESSQQYVLKPEEKKNHSFSPGIENSPLGTDFSTPCIKWATPLAKPIKTLVVTQVASHREIAELVRRVDMDLTLVEVCRPHVFKEDDYYYSWMVPDPAKSLKKALKKHYEVIILAGSLFWNRVPEELRNEILEKVKQGTGLIFIHPTDLDKTLKRLLHTPGIKPDTDFLTFGIPSPLIPGLKEFSPFTKVYSLHQYGKGKILSINYNPTPNGLIWRDMRGLTPAVYNDSGYLFPYWEYYYSFLGKIMFFASQRKPVYLFSKLEFGKSKSNLFLKIDNCGKKKRLELSLNIFNSKWERVEEKNQQLELAPGSNEITLNTKQLTRSGVYFFNLILKNEGKVVNWATVWTKIVNPVRLTGVELSKFAHSQKEPISGKFVVENENMKGLGTYSLRYRIIDMHRRVLMEKTKELNLGSKKNNKITIDFEEKLTIPSLSTLCWLEVELLNKDKIVDYQKKDFTIKLPQEKDVIFTVWGTSEGNHWTQRRLFKQLRKIGFDRATGMHSNSMRSDEYQSLGKNILAADLEYLPMTLHPIKSQDLKGVVRHSCLTDPVYLEKMENDIRNGVGYSKMFFPPSYSVADENSLGKYSSLHDFCQSSTCLKRFRTYLQKNYYSIGTLNKIWHTTFKKWDDVFPYTLSQAKKKNNFVPWAEHRLFMFGIFAEAVGNARRFIKEVDSEGKLSLSGMGTPNIYNGFDWYLISKNLDNITAYNTKQGVADMLRSFKKEGDLFGAWLGYRSPSESVRNSVWWLVFNQFLNPCYFYEGFLFNHGDYTLSEGGEDFKKIISEVKGSGIGKIFAEAEWIPSDIAIHQSTPSLVAANVTANYNALNENVFQNNITGWINLIRDMGFQPPNFLSSYQIEKGILSPEKYPVFILPLSQALSDKEVNEIVSYVRKGGILIADTCAGIFLQNSYRRKKNPLNKVFGISSSGKTARINGCISFIDKDKKIRLPFPPVEKVLKLKSGEALGSASKKSKTKAIQFGGLSIQSKSSKENIPALIVNKYGKGYGIYLNLILSEYPNLRKSGLNSKRVVEALRKTLEKTTFLPQFKVDLPPGCEMVRYRDGENIYLGLIRDIDFTKEENRVKVVLPEEKYIYEVKTHKYLGRTNTISTNLFSGEVKVYALLPHQRKALNVDAKLTSSGQIGYRINLVNTLGENSTGIVRVEVYFEGKLQDCYTKNIKINGGYEDKIPISLNERKGEWKLKFIDVITGEKDEKEICFK